MKEPKSKRFVLTALIGSILFTIITLVSVAYLAGRDVSNEDTSAAVDSGDDEPINHLASIYDVYEQEFGDITMHTQRYAKVGDLVNFNFYYDPSANFSQAKPKWEVELCGNKYTGASSATFYQEVIMPRESCEVKVVIYKGTASEQGFTFAYNPVINKQRVAMRVFQYPKTVDEYKRVTITTDLTAQLQKLALPIDGVNWTILTGDNCIAYPEYQYGKPNYKMVKFSVLGLEPGNCRIKLQASAFACPNCVLTERKVFNLTKAITIRVKQGSGIVDPTSSPTPTSVYVPITGSPTPTAYNPTPTFVWPTNSPTPSSTPTSMISATPTANN